MGRNMVRTSASVIAAVAVAGALTSCGGSGSTVTVTPESSGASKTPAASDTGPGGTGTHASGAPSPGASSGTSSQDQVLGAIAAGAPPEDLQWMVYHVPSSWQRMTDVGAGQREWSIGDRCIVFLDQPGNIGLQPDPDSRGVLEHAAKQTSTVFPGKPKPKYVAGARKKRTLPNVVEGLNGTTTATFEQDTADYGKGRAEFLAYRNGNYALTFTGLCGTRAGFATKKKTFNKFIGGLKAHTTY